MKFLKCLTILTVIMTLTHAFASSSPQPPSVEGPTNLIRDVRQSWDILEQRIREQVSDQIEYTLEDAECNSYLAKVTYHLNTQDSSIETRILELKESLVQDIPVQISFFKDHKKGNFIITVLKISGQLFTAIKNFIVKNCIKKMPRCRFKNRFFILPSPREENRVAIQIFCTGAIPIGQGILSKFADIIREQLPQCITVTARRTRAGILFLIQPPSPSSWFGMFLNAQEIATWAPRPCDLKREGNAEADWELTEERLQDFKKNLEEKI